MDHKCTIEVKTIKPSEKNRLRENLCDLGVAKVSWDTKVWITEKRKSLTGLYWN